MESDLFWRETDAPLKPTAGVVKTVTALPPLCEALEGVCIGGLTSVTVGTLFADCWDEIAVCCALVEEVRITALGAADRTATLSVLAEMGPLLTCETAGCDLVALVSREAPPEIRQFISTVLPFKV